MCLNVFQAEYLLLQRFAKVEAKIANYSHEVAELPQQIFRKIQMALPVRHHFHCRI
jgi:hypothetical protein